jgi:hypothetical protein
MRKRAKKLSLNKTTLRRLDASLYKNVAGAADGDDDGSWVGTCGCWTCKAKSVCCLSQKPCNINSDADAAG